VDAAVKCETRMMRFEVKNADAAVQRSWEARLRGVYMGLTGLEE